MQNGKKDRFIDLIRPGSNCTLAQCTEFAVLQGIYDRVGDICKQCGFNPCGEMEEHDRLDKERRKENFGKPIRGSNADIAAKLKVTKRQAAKMRRRGEL